MAKAYIGCKIIEAEPCSEYDWIVGRGEKWPVQGDNREGFKVKYAGGYISWSPADVFKANYREVTEEERELVTPNWCGGVPKEVKKAAPKNKAAPKKSAKKK